MEEDKKDREQEKACVEKEDLEKADPEKEDLEKKETCPCQRRKKQRSPKELKALLNRLSRIEGQVRGIKTMLEQDAYCPDVLTQVAAVSAALNSFNRVLLENHLKECVTQDILAGKEDTVDELMKTLNQLIR